MYYVSVFSTFKALGAISLPELLYTAILLQYAAQYRSDTNIEPQVWYRGSGAKLMKYAVVEEGFTILCGMFNFELLQRYGKHQETSKHY